MSQRVKGSLRPRGGPEKSGFGLRTPGGVQYISLRVATQVIVETPWECFAIIARAARVRRVPVEHLTLQEAREVWAAGAWHIVFSVDPS